MKNTNFFFNSDCCFDFLLQSSNSLYLLIQGFRWSSSWNFLVFLCNFLIAHISIWMVNGQMPFNEIKKIQKSFRAQIRRIIVNPLGFMWDFTYSATCSFAILWSHFMFFVLDAGFVLIYCRHKWSKTVS